MLIAIIILSILLLFSIFINIIFFLGFKNLYLLQMDKENILKTSKIIQQFEDITLIVNYMVSTTWGQIVDMSQYEKKQIIGLTIFAQEQELFKVAQEITGSKEESEGIMDILKQGFVVPHTTLYQLEEGLWIWQ